MTDSSASSRGSAPEQTAHTVSRGLDLQRTLLEDIRKLAASQGSLIADANHESLMALIRSRQELVNRLDEARVDLAPALARLQQDVEELPESVRADLRGQVDQVRGLVDRIAAIDLDDTRKLEQHRARCRTQLDQVTATATAHAGYHGTVSPSARFTDARG